MAERYIGSYPVGEPEGTEFVLFTTQNGVTFQASVDQLMGVVAELVNEETVEAKEQVLAARDEVMTGLINKKNGYVVATKAALNTLIATPNLDYCDITVLADESYGGLIAEYFWNKSIITQKLTF